MSTISNLFVDAGSDYSVTITATGSNGLPLDLTGYTVKSQMRKSYQSTTAHSLNPTILTPAAGTIKLTLTATQSEAITPGRWLYDVEITQTSTGAKKRVVEGIVIVTPQITQI